MRLHSLHHLTHAVKLFEQAVEFCDVNARAFADALLAAAVEALRVMTLVWGH